MIGCNALGLYNAWEEYRASAAHKVLKCHVNGVVQVTKRSREIELGRTCVQFVTFRAHEGCEACSGVLQAHAHLTA